jgi:glycosyltransferase involved in cell wall biosynthesis
MKVLSVHNYYRYPGGEDYVFEAEAALLESRGHEVLRYTDQNERIDWATTGAAAASAIWSRSSFRAIRQLVRRERPDIVHFHNTFPLISPSALYAARVDGTAIVQTLHNYRLLCPMARLHRAGAACEDCLGRTVAWPGVLHACYRDSRATTGVVAVMLAVHHGLGTWTKKPDVYIALTEFARRKFIAGGLPGDRIVVKPNFVTPDPGHGEGEGEYALFVGRLSPEKGVDVLLEAWKRLGGSVPLVVIGDGPLGSRVAEAARQMPGIEWLGWREREEVHARLRGARFLVFPSVWYETFGMTIVEAFAAARPVVASDLGAPSDLVEPGRTGWLFPPGDAGSLAECVERAWSDPGQAVAMGHAARREYETRYTPDRGYEQLMEIYALARQRAQR